MFTLFVVVVIMEFHWEGTFENDLALVENSLENVYVNA